MQQRPYIAYFPHVEFQNRNIVSFSRDGVPVGIYCGYFDVVNPEVCASQELYKLFVATFAKEKIVGKFSDGFVFLKNSQADQPSNFKIKLRRYDLRLYGVLRAITVDEQSKSHYLFQFGIFKKHKEVDRGEGKQLDASPKVHYFDLRKSN